MTFLPIVGRELRVLARQRLTFQVRFVTAVAAALLGGLFVLGSSAPVAAPRSGMVLFRVLMILAFASALLAGPFLTADSLSRERREGTLGFLFLTDLTGVDVVAGKFVVLGLVPLQGLLAMFPVAGMTVFMGGVTGIELAKAVLVVLNTLFLSLATGLWISSVNSEERRSVGLTLGALVVLATGPEFLGWLAHQLPRPGALPLVRCASPTALLGQVLSTGVSFPTRPFVLGLVYQHALGWILIALAAAVVRQAWRSGDTLALPAAPLQPCPPPTPAAAGSLRRVVGRLTASRNSRVRSAGPVAWVAWRAGWVRAAIRWLTIAVVLGAFAVFAQRAWTAPQPGQASLVGWIFTAGFLGLKLLVAVHVCYFLQDACRSGAMELLLTTPISNAQLNNGHFTAIRQMLVLPVVVLGVSHVLIGLLAQLLAGGDWPSMTIQILAGVIPATLSVFVNVLDLLAVAYFATAVALRHDRPGKALALTAVLVVLLPLGVCGPARVVVDLLVVGTLSRRLDRMRELIQGWYFRGPAERHFGSPRFG